MHVLTLLLFPVFFFTHSLVGSALSLSVTMGPAWGETPSETRHIILLELQEVFAGPRIWRIGDADLMFRGSHLQWRLVAEQATGAYLNCLTVAPQMAMVL